MTEKQNEMKICEQNEMTENFRKLIITAGRLMELAIEEAKKSGMLECKHGLCTDFRTGHWIGFVTDPELSKVMFEAYKGYVEGAAE